MPMNNPSIGDFKFSPVRLSLAPSVLRNCLRNLLWKSPSRCLTTRPACAIGNASSGHGTRRVVLPDGAKAAKTLKSLKTHKNFGGGLEPAAGLKMALSH
jgi:hypothetical protein